MSTIIKSQKALGYMDRIYCTAPPSNVIMYEEDLIPTRRYLLYKHSQADLSKMLQTEGCACIDCLLEVFMGVTLIKEGRFNQP